MSGADPAAAWPYRALRIAALEPAMVVYRQFGGNPHERVVVGEKWVGSGR
jgi:hypothetical protein